VIGTAQLALADTVTLKNGREIHGRLVEERIDSIRMRTAGGTITINKGEIATFSENEEFDFPHKPPAERAAPAESAAGGGRTGQGPGSGGTTGQATTEEVPQPGSSALSGEAARFEPWTWEKGVSEEQIEKLEPLRDKYLEELKALGPDKETRLKEVEVSPQERTGIQEGIKALGYIRRRTGSAPLRRQNNLKELTSTYGVKALPQLVTALGSQSHFVMRMSIQGLGQLHSQAENKEDLEWLLYHFKAPPAFLRLLDNEGEADSGHVRQEANDVLEAITGKSQGYKSSLEPIRSPAESRAYRAWEKYVKWNMERWEKAEAAKEARRPQLIEILDKIRRGEEPEEQETE
jgi:hypothetical protein